MNRSHAQPSPPPRQRHILFWIPLVAYSAAIFWISSGPLPENLNKLSFLGKDKVGHFGIYAMWGFLASWVIVKTWPRKGLRQVLLAATLAGCLYGFSDEAHQYFVPGRDPEVGDLVADALGAAAGAAVFLLLRRKRRAASKARKTPSTSGVAGRNSPPP